MKEKTRKIEHGDFQTPKALAERVVFLLKKMGVRPRTVIEPTCGTGAFVAASLENFSSARNIYGFDINDDYVSLARKNHEKSTGKKIRLELKSADFFKFDWQSLIHQAEEPILIIGNPPWVTNSQLGSMQGKNLPEKINFRGLNGLDALTGKSNFDISEWMLIKLADIMQNRVGIIAMLCKTSVARKILGHAWKNDFKLEKAKMFEIDAKKDFGVATDACLLTMWFANAKGTEKECEIYGSLDAERPRSITGYRDGKIVANLNAYKNSRASFHPNSPFHWRTGIKHDNSKVMELFKVSDGSFKNGLGETVNVEPEYIYPLLKSSHLFNLKNPERWVIVTQKKVGDETSTLKLAAPKLWKYLSQHSESMDGRGSVIYKKRPRFSMFGIGDYTFKPWKIAISGFYKEPRFRLVGSTEGKPILFDDTINFLAFDIKKEAEEVLAYLQSEPVKNAIKSVAFFDSKRPITVELLKTLKIQSSYRKMQPELV